MAIQCCKGCVPPKRHTACWDHCPEYQKEKAEYEARKAAEEGYDAFSTTLLVSPYQGHEMIIEICETLAAQYGIQFYYEDWRPGFRKGQAMAKEYGLYRQKYCGCIKSKEYK